MLAINLFCNCSCVVCETKVFSRPACWHFLLETVSLQTRPVMAITEKNQLSDKRNYKTKSGFLTIKKILEGGSRLSIWSGLFLPGLVITNSSLPASYSPRIHPWLPTADRRERTPEMIPSNWPLLSIVAFSRSQMKYGYIGNLSLLSPLPQPVHEKTTSHYTQASLVQKLYQRMGISCTV